MRRMNQAIISAAVMASLTCGVGLLQAGPTGNTPIARALDGEHVKHLYMHEASDALRDARREVEQAEDIFHGRKDELFAHIDKAITEIKTAVDEAGGESTLRHAEAAPTNLDEDRHPHLHKALHRLQDALDALNHTDPHFGGHRQAAMDETSKAIDQLRHAIEAAER